MNLFGFFARLGSLFAKVLGIVKGVISEEHFLIALAAVREAATHPEWTNEQKRDWVVRLVAAETRLPESLVRLVVELAVTAFKRGK